MKTYATKYKQRNRPLAMQGNVFALPIAAVLSIAALSINFSIVGVVSVILIFLLIRMSQNEDRFINPYLLFLSTPISLLLYSDSVSDLFLPEINMRVQLIIIGGICAYVAGLMILKQESTHHHHSPGRYANARSYSFTIILIMGLVPHALGILTAGIPVLANDVQAARAAYLLPVIGQFSLFLPITMLIAFRRRARFLIFISFALNCFFSAIVLSKFTIMLTGLFFIYAYLRYGGRQTFKLSPFLIIFISVLCTPFLFEYIFSQRQSLSQSEYFWRQQVRFPSELLDRYGDFLYLPYLYLTTPWSNFSYIVEGSNDFSLGARSIMSLASVFQADQLLTLEERPIRMIPFNTHAYPADFYMDFGTFGVVVFSFLLGLFVKWTYINAQRKSDVLSEALWISVGFASFLLFFSNHFTSLTYPIVSFILFNFYRFMSEALMPKYRRASTTPREAFAPHNRGR